MGKRGETIWQKNKKNNNRVKVADRPFYSSIQRNYGQNKMNPKQGKLI